MIMADFYLWVGLYLHLIFNLGLMMTMRLCFCKIYCIKTLNGLPRESYLCAGTCILQTQHSPLSPSQNVENALFPSQRTNERGIETSNRSRGISTISFDLFELLSFDSISFNDFKNL